MSVLSNLTLHSFYIPALVVIVTASSYGVAIGRPIFQTGTPYFPLAIVLPFNYPATVVVFELLVTSVLAATCLVLCRLVAHCLQDAQTSSSTDCGYLELEVLSDTSIDPVSKKSIDCSTTLKHLPWAVLVAGAAISSNYVLFSAPLEIFILSRAIVLPASFILSTYVFEGESPREKILPCLVLVLSISTGTYRPSLPISWPVIALAIASSVLLAAWLLKVEDSCRHSSWLGRLRYQNIIDSLKLACYVSMLSAILLFPVLIYSGELGNILRNCYILENGFFWLRILLRALCQCILLISSILLVKETSATTATLVLVLGTTSQTGVLTRSALDGLQILGLIIYCILTFLYLSRADGRAGRAPRFKDKAPPTDFKAIRTASVIHLSMRLVIASLAFGEWGRRESAQPTRGHLITAPSLQGNQSYLGRRPQLGAVANFELLTAECRGSYEGTENTRNVTRCLDFLSSREDLYLRVPDTPAQPRNIYTVGGTEPERSTTGNVCEGPMIPYHVWWTGPPTWRVELFIKSYFYTQNYNCSRLWIWINSEHDSNALSSWLTNPQFACFQTLVERGDIILKEWKFPARVPMFGDVDPKDRSRYFQHPSPPNSAGEQLVADYIVRDASGREWLQFSEYQSQIAFFDVAASDAARLVILHLYGGVYIDVDMLLMRDLRPLLLADVPFAERWGAQTNLESYNNAIVALPANSTMSSFLLRGGVRQNMVFHFNVLGRMLVKEGRDDIDGNGLAKLETAFFDPVWAEVDSRRDGPCTVPCLKHFEQVFQGAPIPYEWESLNQSLQGSSEGVHRTMENFFRGGFAYHLHNQWNALYEPQSWLDIITTSHNNFFSGESTNPYGEYWNNTGIAPYKS